MKKQRLQQGRFSRVVFSGDEVDAFEALDGEVLEAAVILDGKRLVHDTRLSVWGQEKVAIPSITPSPLAGEGTKIHKIRCQIAIIRAKRESISGERDTYLGAAYLVNSGVFFRDKVMSPKFHRHRARLPVMQQALKVLSQARFPAIPPAEWSPGRLTPG